MAESVEVESAPPTQADQPQDSEVTAAPEEKCDTKKLSPPTSDFASLSFSIWPPSQRTRDAVLNRLIETLSTSSILSQRYGTVPREEANTVARQIEEEAFSSASASYNEGSAASTEDDGMEILQIYSREISKRMLETVKARASQATPTVISAAAPVPSDSAADSSAPEVETAEASPAAAAAAVAAEETASVESESSHA